MICALSTASLLLQVPGLLRFHQTERTAGFSILLPRNCAWIKVRYCASEQAKWAPQPQFHTAFRSLNKADYVGGQLSGSDTYRTDITQTVFSKVSQQLRQTGKNRSCALEWPPKLHMTFRLNKESNFSNFMNEFIFWIDSEAPACTFTHQPLMSNTEILQQVMHHASATPVRKSKTFYKCPPYLALVTYNFKSTFSWSLGLMTPLLNPDWTG